MPDMKSYTLLGVGRKHGSKPPSIQLEEANKYFGGELGGSGKGFHNISGISFLVSKVLKSDCII